MIILNFSHSLTENQINQIKKIVGISGTDWSESRVVRVSCYVDLEKDFAPQIEGILSSVPNSVWNDRILIVPPPIAQVAQLVLLGVQAKCGYFPQSIRIKRKKKSVPPEYIVAEIIDLTTFKNRMRAGRSTQKIVTQKI